MKGRARTTEEEGLHDRIAALGCIACRQDGIYNSWVSIHHVHGRTRPDAHKHVLPLCHPHHQGDGSVLAVHQNKARWEDKYGKQDDLVREIFESLGLLYTAPGKRQSAPKIEKPLVEGTALKNPKAKRKAKKKPVVAKVSDAEGMHRIAVQKRKVATRKFDAARSSAIKLPVSSSRVIAKEPTEAEVAYREDQKEVQKRLRTEAKARYELQNREKIEADKEKARLLRKKFRQKMKAASAERSAK